MHTLHDARIVYIHPHDTRMFSNNWLPALCLSKPQTSSSKPLQTFVVAVQRPHLANLLDLGDSYLCSFGPRDLIVSQNQTLVVCLPGRVLSPVLPKSTCGFFSPLYCLYWHVAEEGEVKKWLWLPELPPEAVQIILQGTAIIVKVVGESHINVRPAIL